MSVCQYGTRIDKRRSEYCMDTRVERIKTLRHLNALGCLMEFVVALYNLCFFWENEDWIFGALSFASICVGESHLYLETSLEPLEKV